MFNLPRKTQLRQVVWLCVACSSSSFALPHAGDGMVACAEASRSRIWTLLNHLVCDFLHVLEQITVLPAQGLQTGDGLPWQDQPVVPSLGILIFDHYHRLVFIDLEKYSYYF